MPTNRRRIGSLVAVVLPAIACLLVNAPQARAQNDVWQGVDFWENPASWSLGRQPLANEVAEFGPNGTPVVQYQSSRVVGQLLFTSSAQEYFFLPAGAIALQINGVGGIGINNQSGIGQHL